MFHCLHHYTFRACKQRGEGENPLERRTVKGLRCFLVWNHVVMFHISRIQSFSCTDTFTWVQWPHRCVRRLVSIHLFSAAVNLPSPHLPTHQPTVPLQLLKLVLPAPLGHMAAEFPVGQRPGAAAPSSLWRRRCCCRFAALSQQLNGMWMWTDTLGNPELTYKLHSAEQSFSLFLHWQISIISIAF